MIRRGDTLVEVLLATVILSIVLAGAFSLSNRAIQTGQSSLERTEAVNIVRQYAETLKFIHTTQADGYDEVWERIKSAGNSGEPVYDGDYFCDVTPAYDTRAIYFDFDAIENAAPDPIDPDDLVKSFSLSESNGRLQYADATDHESDDLFAVWMEVYDPDPPATGIVDIHIRACWDALGGDNVNRVGSVVRLSETRDT